MARVESHRFHALLVGLLALDRGDAETALDAAARFLRRVGEADRFPRVAGQGAGDRVLVGLWADTMEGRPTRWWSVLTVRDGQVIAVEDYAHHRDAVRTFPPKLVGGG